MKFDKAISFHELRTVIFRAGGVVLSSIGGFLGLKAFLAFDQRDAAVLVGVIGYLVFLPLAQLGLGRPSYGEVRQRFVVGTLAPALVRRLLKLFLWQALVACLFFALLAIGFGVSQGYGQGWAGLFLFALGHGALGAGLLQKDLAYALSLDPDYERWEFFRRATALVSSAAILSGRPLWIGGLICLGPALFTQVWMGRKIMALSESLLPEPEGGSDWPEIKSRLACNAKKYLPFSVNELVFYNLPLLVFTWDGFAQGIIYFGVWNKFFMLIVLPMRMLVDARVNRQTASYFAGDKHLVLDLLVMSRNLALAIVIMGALGVAILKPVLLRWVGAKLMVLDPWFVPSLLAWSAGNSLQHVFGSFTVSYRDGFGFALKASMLTLLLVGTSFLCCLWAHFSPGAALMIAGVAYSVCAWAYVHHVNALLSDAQAGTGG